MRLVFAGTPVAAVPTLDALLKSRHQVAAVITRPDARAGRGLKLGQSPVAQRAAEAGIEVLTPARPSEPEFLARLREIGPDCCPVTAYGALLPQTALDIPPRGWINLHFSVLPAWRGAAPVQHAILHGDDVAGATTFRIVRELDAGPVYGVVTEAIRPEDTAGDLLERLSTAGAGLLVATLDGIESGELEAREQPADGISLAPKITPADAEVDWSKPAIAIARQIRACTPEPGAWTQLDGVRIKLWPVTLAPGSPAPGSPARGSPAPGSAALGSAGPGSLGPGAPPSASSPGSPAGGPAVNGSPGRASTGAVPAGPLSAGPLSAGTGSTETGPLAPGELRISGHSVLAGTGSAPVTLGDVQANGKRRMPAGDWARGLRLDGRSAVLG